MVIAVLDVVVVVVYHVRLQAGGIFFRVIATNRSFLFPSNFEIIADLPFDYCRSSRSLDELTRTCTGGNHENTYLAAGPWSLLHQTISDQPLIRFEHL